MELSESENTIWNTTMVEHLHDIDSMAEAVMRLDATSEKFAASLRAFADNSDSFALIKRVFDTQDRYVHSFSDFTFYVLEDEYMHTDEKKQVLTGAMLAEEQQRRQQIESISKLPRQTLERTSVDSMALAVDNAYEKRPIGDSARASAMRLFSAMTNEDLNIYLETFLKV